MNTPLTAAIWCLVLLGWSIDDNCAILDNVYRNVNAFVQPHLSAFCISSKTGCVIIDLGCRSVIHTPVRISIYASFIDLIPDMMLSSYSPDLVGTYRWTYTENRYVVLNCDRCLLSKEQCDNYDHLETVFRAITRQIGISDRDCLKLLLTANGWRTRSKFKRLPSRIVYANIGSENPMDVDRRFSCRSEIFAFAGRILFCERPTPTQNYKPH